MNVVFFELKRRGYRVFIGKIEDKEIDFMTEKDSHKFYVQVCFTLGDEKTLKRELAPLFSIKDNYEKIIITADKSFIENYDGIKIKNIQKWMCE